LGEYNNKDLPVSERERLLPELLTLYRNHLDPGQHAAAAWLLHQWGRDKEQQEFDNGWVNDKDQREKNLESIRQGMASSPGTAKSRWFVNNQGQTFVAFPGPVEFQMGSPPTEADRGEQEEFPHPVRIGHSFALATTHVTREQFKRFRPHVPETMEWAPDKRCPMFQVTWYQAAEYCNWLSEQDGLPESEWCYEPLRDSNALPAVAGSIGLLAGSRRLLPGSCGLLPRTYPQYVGGMKPAQNYLQRTGYRLPTEAEWEYACRAGAVTSRYYGESKDLLGKYACYETNAQNQVWPVANLKPNDWGLFDMHGQLWVWCHKNSGDSAPITNAKGQPVRGGSWGDAAANLRCANRSGVLPSSPIVIVGFRVARTFR
jgi:formylglycine-generating enzyme required for sulfatase activity